MRLWQYMSAALAGALTLAIGFILLLLKGIKPVINASTYVEKMENELKKIKAQGNQVTFPPGDKEIKTKPRKFLGIIKLKPRKKP